MALEEAVEPCEDILHGSSHVSEQGKGAPVVADAVCVREDDVGLGLFKLDAVGLVRAFELHRVATALKRLLTAVEGGSPACCDDRSLDADRLLHHQHQPVLVEVIELPRYASVLIFRGLSHLPDGASRGQVLRSVQGRVSTGEVRGSPQHPLSSTALSNLNMDSHAAAGRSRPRSEVYVQPYRVPRDHTAVPDERIGLREIQSRVLSDVRCVL